MSSHIFFVEYLWLIHSPKRVFSTNPLSRTRDFFIEKIELFQEDIEILFFYPYIKDKKIRYVQVFLNFCLQTAILE